MPLIKSKSPEAFKSNIKAEMKAGKPMSQSLAIAYSMKKKAKKMADGGEVSDERAAAAKKMREAFASKSGSPGPSPTPDAAVVSGYAEGGDVEMHVNDLVDRIMNKRKMMSEGGEVANGANDEKELADFDSNNFDDLALRDDLESSYTGANSGDSLGDAQEDHDRADIIAKIMKQRSMKQHNPRPA